MAKYLIAMCDGENHLAKSNQDGVLHLLCNPHGTVVDITGHILRKSKRLEWEGEKITCPICREGRN